MRIQIKLFFLIFLILAAFAASLILYLGIEGNRAVALFSDDVQDKKIIFDKNLELKGKSLENLVYDYTYWDEMVNFIAAGNKTWAEKTIDNRVLFNFDADAVWVYNPDFALLYTINHLGYDSAKEKPLPQEAFNRLFMRNRFCHFFIDTPRGLMEIRGATVHPTSDVPRKSPARGYFFAGRLWDKGYYIEELSKLTKSTISIAPAAEKMPAISVDPEYGLISFSKILKGWDGQPLRRLDISSQYSGIKDFIRMSRVIFFMLCAFAALILLLLLIFVMRWVNVPLRLISTTLRTEDSIYIDRMRKDKNEFDDIARMIHKFFKNKAALIQEIAERRKAEQDLRIAYTELQQTQQQLIQAEKLQAIGMLASGLAHEVKNPLGIIIQAANYLEKKLPKEQEDIFNTLEMIKKSVAKADNIIRSLLDFSRVTKLDLKPQDINSILDDSLALVKQDLEDKHIEVVKETLPDMPKVLADRNKMEQLFVNILLNGIQSISDKGRITIRTYARELKEAKNGAHGIGEGRFEAGGKVAVIEIEDTGSGIAEENVQKIFDPFFTTKRVGEGVGLGLSICRNIIDMHGGLIELDSRPDKGTRVIITLAIASGAR